MSNELTKSLMCISMRNGVNIWVENDRIENLKQVLRTLNVSKFIDLGDQMINSADITGIYDAATMADRQMEKRGHWKCKHGVWHDGRDKGDDCWSSDSCKNYVRAKRDQEEKERLAAYIESAERSKDSSPEKIEEIKKKIREKMQA